jgi:magnesium chelatase subunit D
MSPFEPPFEPEPAGDAPALSDAMLAATLLAIDPAGLGGISVRAWSGPARDAYVRYLGGLLPDATPLRKMPLHISDDRLLGGIDLAGTLQAGRPVMAQGLLSEVTGGVLVVAMAERLTAGTAARLAGWMDGGEAGAVVALDEGSGPDEAPPTALLERLAFSTATLPDPSAEFPSRQDIAAARAALRSVQSDPAAITQLCTVAAMLGIASLRAVIFAARAACAAGALAGRDAMTEADIAVAIRLVLAPRATQMPPAPDDSPAPEEPEPRDGQDETQKDPEPLEDSVAEAAEAALPPALLAAIAAAGGPRRATRGAGKSGTIASLQRGRPAGIKQGQLGGGARLALLDTLRAAAPWQAVRQRARAGRGVGRIAVRAEDFRIRRFHEDARTIAIFAVDASGSSAVNRLAEAKGAIQMLLAECYVRRDQVALIAFRNRAAECLLPPTGALARAKRCLAGLPGGGPTPLSHGIAAARSLAGAERRKGLRPLLVLLTDGGANIGRDGKPGRAAAAADARAAAKLCRDDDLRTLVVDTAPRPNAFVAALAREMGGRYLALPYADSAGLSRAVRQEGRLNG